MTAIPLVHPWGNRLGRWGYRVGRTTVDLRGLDLPTDDNGLPIHGNLRGAAVRASTPARSRAACRAEFDYGAQHRPAPRRSRSRTSSTVDAAPRRARAPADDRGRADGRTAVPISFCWHPYLRLPAGARGATGCCAGRSASTSRSTSTSSRPASRTPQPAERAPIGRRTFDDHYALGRDRTLLGRGRRAHAATSRSTGNYPFGQLYVPPRRRLHRDRADDRHASTRSATATRRSCEPGDRFRASFTIACSSVTPPRLLPPGAYTGFLGALCVPDDLYWVSRDAGRDRRHGVPGPRRLGAAARGRYRSRRVPHPRCGSLRRVAVHRDRVPAAGSRERWPAR